MKLKTIVTAICILLLAEYALADFIKVGEVTYNNVIVKEGQARYYIQVPNEGRVFSVNKSDVEGCDVFFNDDQALMQQLMSQWHANREKEYEYEISAKQSEKLLAQAKAMALAHETKAPEPKVLMIKGTSKFRRSEMPDYHTEVVTTDGRVGYVNLKNVPLRVALKALLRMVNLDYAVENGFIWISTPAIIKAQTLNELETRYYGLADSSATLPKIVVNGAIFGQNARGMGMSTGSGQFGRGGSTRAGVGMQGMQGGRGGMGAQGMMGGGMGGMGGGGAGYSVADQITNISDLFSNIDDRIVGEAPAIIGTQSTVR